MRSDDDAELEHNAMEGAPLPASDSARPAGAPSRWWARLARMRRGRGVAVGIIIAVLLLCLLASISGGWQSLADALHLTSSPAAIAASPSESFVSLVDGVPWGRLSVDGRAVTATDVLQRYTGLEQVGTLLALTPGHHTIEYVAPPFATLRCRLSVPRAAADTCRLVRSTGVAAPSVRAIDLGAAPEHLAPAARAALDTAVAATIADAASTTSLAPGERVRAADGSVQAASELLAVGLSYTLAVGQPGGPGAAASCGALCRTGDDANIAAASGAPLPLVAAVTLHWHYTPAGGEPAFDGAAGPTSQSAPGLLQLDLRWDGSWHVARTPQPVGSAPCSVAEELLVAASPSLAAQGTFAQLPAARDADGCLVRWWSCADPATPCATGTPASPAATPTTLDRATFLYRYGILFAADASAHTLAPSLPAPNRAERASAARIWSDFAAGA